MKLKYNKGSKDITRYYTKFFTHHIPKKQKRAVHYTVYGDGDESFDQLLLNMFLKGHYLVNILYIMESFEKVFIFCKKHEKNAKNFKKNDLQVEIEEIRLSIFIPKETHSIRIHSIVD